MQRPSRPQTATPLTRPKATTQSLNQSQTTVIDPISSSTNAWIQTSTQIERAAQRPGTAGANRLSATTMNSGPPLIKAINPTITKTSPPSSRASSRPQSATMRNSTAWGNNSQFAASQSLGMNSTSSPPPPNNFTPYTPNVPFNSFTPFTGPYSYLAQHAPTATSGNAHIDWLRLEVLKRDIKVMSETIKAGLEFQNDQTQSKIDGGNSVRSQSQASIRSSPSYAPLPLPLLNQLGGASFMNTLSNRSLLKSEESKDTSDPQATSEEVVQLDEWEVLVNRALQRFGHSSDYLQAMTSTVGLLEVWCVQVSRLADTATWMSGRALTGYPSFKSFTSALRKKKDPKVDTLPQQPFSFKTILSNLLIPVPTADSQDNNGTTSRGLLGNSSSTSSLALASGPATLHESSLFHALPSLASLLDTLQTLTSYVQWADAHFTTQRQLMERMKKEQRNMVVEMNILASAVQEAAADRPKTKRVIHEHVHVNYTRTLPGGSESEEERPKEKSSRPTSAISTLSTHPSSATTNTFTTYPSRHTNSSSPPPELIPTSTDDSLRHEIWLLRTSLEEERLSRKKDVDDQTAEIKKQMAELKLKLQQAQHENATLEQSLSTLRTTLSTKTDAYNISLQRLQLQLSTVEKAALEKAHSEVEANREKLWQEREKAEKEYRDRIEKERWEIHTKTMDELKKKLTETEKELATTQKELLELRQTQQTLRTDTEARRLDLLEKHQLEEQKRKHALEISQREERSRQAFEAELANKRKALEKEMKSKDDSHSLQLKALEDELNRLRREKTHLQSAYDGLLKKDQRQSEDFMEYQEEMKDLKKDLLKSQKSFTELETRFKKLTETSEATEAKLRDLIAQQEKLIAELRQSKAKEEHESGDVKAQLLGAQAELVKLRSELQSVQSASALAREQVIRLETELDTSRIALNDASNRMRSLEASHSTELAAARKEIAELQDIIRNLENRLAGLQSQLLHPVPATLNSPIRSPSASMARLNSPSSSMAALRSHPTTPKPTSREAEEQAKKELEQSWSQLRAAQQTLASSESDLSNLKAILAQQRAELTEEQRLLQTSASLLHSELLAKLQSLLPLNYATVSKLADKFPGLTLVAVDELRDAVRDKTELTDAIHSNLDHEIQVPATKLHANSLSERLEALRRACEFHENRLAGLSPSPNFLPAPAATSSPSTNSLSASRSGLSVQVATPNTPQKRSGYGQY